MVHDNGKGSTLAATGQGRISENEEQPQFTSRLHKVVTAPWVAFVHNEPVNEGSLTQLLNYLTAGVLWAFAGLVVCMTVVPI